MEALLNFPDHGLRSLWQPDILNASLLDESASRGRSREGRGSMREIKGVRRMFFVAEDFHHADESKLLRTQRGPPRPIRILVRPALKASLPPEQVLALTIQYPATDGVVHSLDAHHSPAPRRRRTGRGRGGSFSP